MINLVGSSIELGPMLQGIVDLATEATDCHACFIYLLGDGVLTIRAASPVYAAAVDVVQMRLDEGLTGWVARHRQAEFIRDNAMADPRMKFFPILEEERFQSMVAVPIVSRANDTIGVIVLHTVAPREFTEDTLKLLVHIASLVSGAIENAQLYDQQRRRVDALTSLSGLAQEVATAGDSGDIGRAVTRGMRRLLGAEVCQLYRIDRTGSGLQMLSSSPETTAEPEALSATALLLAAFDGSASRPPARTLWPGLDVADLMVTPLISGGERLGLLCAGAPPRRPFTGEDTEMARAIAHLAAIAIKRAELIEGLTNANIVKDLFEALAAGRDGVRGREGDGGPLRSDEALPDAVRGAGRRTRAGLGRVAGRRRGARARPRRARAAERGRGGSGAGAGGAVAGSRAPQRIEEVVRACRDLGRRRECRDRAQRAALVRGRLGARLPAGARRDDDRAGACSATVARSGTPRSARTGTSCTSRAENAPHDRMRAAVDRLIDYDARRRTALLDTLERYLAERRSVIESARELFIHPNTLRQRLARIEDLTGLKLDEDDLAVARVGDQAGATPRAAGGRTRRLTVFVNQEHRDLLRLAADPLGLLGPVEVADDAIAVGVGGHHDRVAAGELCLLEDALGRLAGTHDMPVSLDALALEALDRFVTMSRCSFHSALVGSSPGICIPNETPCIRAIVNTRTLASEALARSTTRAITASENGRPSDASRIRSNGPSDGLPGACCLVSLAVALTGRTRPRSGRAYPARPSPPPAPVRLSSTRFR